MWSSSRIDIGIGEGCGYSRCIFSGVGYGRCPDWDNLAAIGVGIGEGSGYGYSDGSGTSIGTGDGACLFFNEDGGAADYGCGFYNGKYEIGQ